MEPRQILTKYWGHPSFRPLQEDIIRDVLEGKDTLALLPTGGGKSICFQVPALVKDGICIVVSPLIALMKDQVVNLNQRGIKAVALHSGMKKREIDITLDNCIYGKIKFLYVSPERIETELFRERFKKMNVNLLAVDEAHCVSQWGYDFRPAYLNIASLRELKPDTPLLALTATATPDVVDDLQEKLEFKEPNVLRKSFERKNLAYVVLQEENKYKKLLEIIEKIPGTGIIYARTRKDTRDISNYLKQLNISASYYHAGLSHAERSARQQAWISNKCRIIVATNAFGMGIDKPNVRFVVHLHLPETLEAYFQEAGRAGRDGKKSYAVLLHEKADSKDLEKRVKGKFPPIEDIKRVYQALGNFFELPEGRGRDTGFDFDLIRFSENYNLHPLLIYNSINFLEKEGYLSLSDKQFTPSRIMFKTGKGELYRFQVANPKQDFFIKTLLRSYGGMFDQFVHINENELARRLKTTGKDIVKRLKFLEKAEILEYIPQTDSPVITYLEDRLPLDSLLISRENYQTRKEIAFKKMKAVIQYAATGHKCRSRMLLEYFGESDAYRCGICDVCLERNKLELSNLEFSQVSDQIKAFLKEEPASITKVVSHIKDSREDKIIKVIEWLLDNGKISYNKEQKLKWNK